MYHVGLIWQLRFIFRHAVDFRWRGYQHRNMSPRDGHCQKLKIQLPASEKKKEKRKKKENKTRGVLGAGQNQASGHLEPPKALPSCVPRSRAGWCACTLLALGLYLLPRYAKPLALYAWPQ